MDTLPADLRRLAALLEDPQPGLASWHLACSRVWRRILEGIGPPPRLDDRAVHHINGDPNDHRPENLRIVELDRDAPGRPFEP